MENQQQPIDVESIVNAAFETCIWLEALSGDANVNDVNIAGKDEFIGQITRDLEKAGVKVVKR